MSKNIAAAKPAKNFREFERENADVKKGEHLKLPLERIKKKKGFNPRDLTKPETVEKIESMKQSFMNDQFVPLIVVRMAPDGEHVHIVDGECRYTAAVLADKELRAAGGKGLESLEVVRFTGTEKDALVQTMLSNEGEKLMPLEQSEVVRRLLDDEGLDRAGVANELHKSIGWIDRLIVVSKLPEDVKAVVREGKISAELAVKYVKNHGDGALEAINADLEKAAGKGEKKVTAKHSKDEGGGEEGDEGGSSKPKKDDTEKLRKKAQQQTALALAFALPEKIKKPRNMKDEDTYPIELSGAAIKLLVSLQDNYTAEIEAALEAEKAGAEE